jgi:hypothetical protein
VTFTPSASASDTIVPNDQGIGGAWSPASVVVSGAGAVTSQYTPPRGATGPITLTGTSSQEALFTAATVTAYAVLVDALVVKSGKWFRLSTNSSGTQSNSNWHQASITALNATPTFEVNGNVVQVGPATYDATCNFVAYLAQCGGVQSLAMVNAGLASYTHPTFTPSGGGGSGLVLANSGVGTVATGILSYTPGGTPTGYTQSFAIQIPTIAGQSPTRVATAWVTVVAGAVTSVVPLTGGPLSYGAGFNGTTATGIALPGSGALAYADNADGTYAWINSPVPGSGLTVTATIGTYVIPPLVTTPGTGYTSPPTIAITDPGGSGTGATCVPVMTGPLSTDTITYSAPAGWVTTSIDGIPGFHTPAATNVPVTNSVGVLEGPVGHTQGFTAAPTLQAGFNIGSNPINVYGTNYFTGKNKLKGAAAWQPGFGCTGHAMVLDANHYMASWPANSWVSSQFYGQVAPGGSATAVVPAGHWSIPYDDDWYGGALNGATVPAFVSLSNVGSFGTSLAIVAGPSTALPVAGAVTISGGAITGIALGTPGTGLQAVLVTITGTGTNAAAVGTVSGGAVTGYTVMCGGSGWSGTPTVTVTPVAMSAGVVTLVYNVAFTPNVGQSLLLTLEMVSGADGLVHAHNPWVICPNNTVD